MNDLLVEIEIDQWIENRHSFEYEAENIEEDELVKYLDF